MKFEARILIERPVSEVFEFLAVNFRQAYPLIEPTNVEIQQKPEGAVKVGTKFRTVNANAEQKREWARATGRASLKPSAGLEITPEQPSVTVLEVTRFEPEHLFSFRLNQEPIGTANAAYTFEPGNRPGHTRLSCVLELEKPAFYLKLIAPLVRPWADRYAEKQLERLKQALEQPKR